MNNPPAFPCGEYRVPFQGMTDEQKQAIWTRIDAEATSWRYNIYKDRVKI